MTEIFIVLCFVAASLLTLYRHRYHQRKYQQMNFPYNGKLDYDFIRSMYAAKAYRFYDSGAYNINIFGIRNKDISVVNEFNDLIGVAYLDEFLNKQCLVFQGTTKPGLTYLKDKLGNAEGTAILCEGQYPKCWIIGKHNIGKEYEHEAYVQAGPGVFKTWRDKNSDGKFDFSGPIYTDVQGLNGHTTRDFDINNVGGFSAACQVVQDDKEHSVWLAVGKRSAELYVNMFTYTLFRQQ